MTQLAYSCASCRDEHCPVFEGDWCECTCHTEDEEELFSRPASRPEWGRTQNDFRFEDGLPDDGKGDES